MSRYFVTHQEVVLACGMLTVTMRTSTAQHLWLLWTVKSPYIRPIPFRGQQSTVPHQNNLSLEIMGDVEQEEPGNTTEHTFMLPWPGQADTIFFYSINLGTGSLKASRSPLFVYKLTQSPLLFEDWSKGLTGNYPWTFATSSPADAVYPSLNSLVLDCATNSGCSITLDFTTLIQQFPVPACDLMLTIGAAKLSGPDNMFALTQFLLGPTPGQQIDFFTFFHVINAFQPDAYLVQHGQAAPSPAGGISYRTGLGAAFYQPSCMYPVTPIPYTPSYPSSITLAVTTAGNPTGSPPLRARFGPLVLSSVNGQLIDISGEWRGQRLAPFIP